MKSVFKLFRIMSIILLLVACSSNNPGGNNSDTQDIRSLNIDDRITGAGRN